MASQWGLINRSPELDASFLALTNTQGLQPATKGVGDRQTFSHPIFLWPLVHSNQQLAIGLPVDATALWVVHQLKGPKRFTGIAD